MGTMSRESIPASPKAIVARPARVDHRMDLSRGIRYLGHARDQMRARGITDDQVMRALREYHTTYPAEPLPYQSVHATVYVATIDGRELKVYVEEGSDPPLVRTVVRRDPR
jgi:hypothetical protein